MGVCFVLKVNVVNFVLFSDGVVVIGIVIV